MTDAGRKKRKRFLLVALAILAAALLAEGALRFLLFSDAAAVSAAAAGLREEIFYADAYSDDDAWVLRATFRPGQAASPHPRFHPRLGWVSEDLDPESLRHAGEPVPPGERLVLLYGDSFARGLTPRADSWEGLLEQSELGPMYQLLNLGVGGYGLDQIELLLDATIERYAERKPLVIVGILVEDDLDRTALALRNFPKPKYELAEEGLVLQPPLAHSASEFAALRPPHIPSYLWRLFLYRALPRRVCWAITGEEGRRTAKRVLCRALLERMRTRLVGLGLEHFVVLFHAEKAMATTGPYSWQEPFLYETLRELGIPFVSSKRALLEDIARTGFAPEDYLKLDRHYDAYGNTVVFTAFRRGLAGEFEPPEGYLPGAPARVR